MSVPLEHNYIALSEPSSMQNPSKSSTISDNKTLLHFKATELRLGLPGLSQENCSPTKNNVSRTKRGFCDVDFDGVGKWAFDERSEEVKVNDGKKAEKLVSSVVEEKKKGFVNGESCRVNPAVK